MLTELETKMLKQLEDCAEALTFIQDRGMKVNPPTLDETLLVIIEAKTKESHA